MKIGYFCYHLSGNGPRTRACDVINGVAEDGTHDVVVLTGEPENVTEDATVVPIAADEPIDAARKARRHFADVDLVQVPINVYQVLFVRTVYRGPLVAGVGPGIQSTLRHGLLGRLLGVDVKVKTHESMTRWDRYGYETAVCTATIDREEFYPYDEDRIRELRRDRGIDPETDVLLYVGKLSELQGARLVSDLAKQLRTDETTRIIVAGDGPLRDLFETRSDLEYVGFVDNDETAAYYNLADVTVIPRKWDVTSNVGLESIACGTPVVTTADGVVRDLFFERGTYVWADRTVESLESTIETLLANDATYREQVDRGLETFEDMTLTLEAAVATHLEVYDDVVGVQDSSEVEAGRESTPRPR